MKGCKDCGENNLDKFEVNKFNGEKIYYSSRCKSCYGNYYNAIKNERVKEKARARRDQYLQDIQNL